MIQEKLLKRKSYLGNFMLLNMLGFLWLDGREIDWPGSEKITLADGSVTTEAELNAQGLAVQ